AEILTLGVLPRFRRRGVGRSLLAAVTDRLARAGGARLLLEVAADNVAAQALYRDAGFLEVGRRPGYYQRASGQAVDALLLACVIVAHGPEGASAGCGGPEGSGGASTLSVAIVMGARAAAGRSGTMPGWSSSTFAPRCPLFYTDAGQSLRCGWSK